MTECDVQSQHWFMVSFTHENWYYYLDGKSFFSSERRKKWIAMAFAQAEAGRWINTIRFASLKKFYLKKRNLAL